MFSCQAYQESGEITFTLRELKKNGKALVTMQYPLKKIRDFNRYFFIFPPIKDSRGKEYELSLTSPSVPEGKGVSLWYEANDSKLGGKMHVNNVPVDGALYFSAYYFTGDYPRTDWEGRRQLVINDGLYIYIPELQLYYEQSKEFHIHTATHSKIQLVEKAKTVRGF